MQKIGDILGKTLAKYNLGPASEALLIGGRIKKHLTDHFGEVVLKFVFFEKFKDGAVFLKAKDAAWTQELQLVSNDLLVLLRDDFREKEILKIVVSRA